MNKGISNKIIKYLFYAFIIAVGFLLNSELVIKTTFSVDPYTKKIIYFDYEEMLTPEELTYLQQEFLQKQIELVGVTTKWKNDSDEWYIGGSSSALEQYSEETGIKEGNYISFFGTNYKIKFCDFAELSDYSADKITFYLVADSDIKRELPAQWLIDIGFLDIKGSNVNIPDLIRKQTFYIWTMIVATLLLFSYYDCMQQRKGFFVQASLGETITSIVVKNLLLDTVFFLMFFWGMYVFAKRYANIEGGYGIIFTIQWMLIAGNVLVYLPLVRYSFQEGLSRIRLSKKVLTVSYGIRLFSLVMVIVLVCLNYSVLEEYFTATRHKSFYRDFKDGYVISSFSEDLGDKLYLETADAGNASLFLYDIEESKGIRYTVLYYNRNSVEWLFSKYPKLKNADASGDAIVFYPYSLQDLERFPQVIHFESDDTLRYTYYCYNERITAPGTRGADFINMNWWKDPIIVVDLRENMLKYSIYLIEEFPYISHRSFVVTLPVYEGEETRIYLKDGTEIELTSLYAEYQEAVAAIKRVFMWVLAIFILVFFLEVSVTVKIIHLEFEMNAMQYILERILGYSLWQIYYAQFIYTTVLCIAGALLAKRFLESIKLGTCLSVAAVIWLLEMAIMIGYIIYMEHVNIQKILKNGSL